jgi:hypothetical protein
MRDKIKYSVDIYAVNFLYSPWYSTNFFWHHWIHYITWIVCFKNVTICYTTFTSRKLTIGDLKICTQCSLDLVYMQIIREAVKPGTEDLPSISHFLKNLLLYVLLASELTAARYKVIPEVGSCLEITFKLTKRLSDHTYENQTDWLTQR